MRDLLKVVGAAALLSGAMAPASVQAFGLPAIDQSNIAPGGVSLGCNFSAFSDPNNSFGFSQSADVTLFNSTSPGFEAAGGNGWDNGSINSVSYDAITVADIESVCTQLQAGSVAIVSQNGADAASYAAEDYIGITFTATPVGDTQSYTYTIALQGASSTSVVATRVVNNVPNVAPSANAGSNQSVQSGTQVTLDGSGSTDSDGTITSYAWTRTGGTGSAGNAVLSDPTAVNPTFTDSSLTSNSASVTHVFSLVVTDNDSEPSVADTVTITITPPPNAAPTATASAASTTVTSGNQVTLLGSGTDTDGTIASYAWTRTGGTGSAGNITLNTATAQNPTFTDNSLTSTDTPVTHEFALVVTDDDGAPSAASAVTITINPPAETTPPTALSLVRSNPAATITNADTLVWQLTFDEAVQNVDAGDFAVSGTSANLVVTGSGATYNLTLSGGDLSSVTGTVSIGFSSPTIQDLAGNAFAGAAPATNESSYSVDNGQDTLVLTTPSASVSGEFQVTGVFTANGPAAAPNASNPGLGVLSSVQITNGTRTGSSSFSNNTMTFNVTPSGPGAVTVSFPAGAATDSVGNPTQASNTLSVSSQDTTPPVVSVPANIVTTTDPGQPTAAVTYAAPTATDNVSVTSGPTLVAGLASGGAFPVGITTVTYEASDAAGNIGSGSFTVTVSDGENPVVSVPANIAVTTDAGQPTATVTYAAATATDNVGVTTGPTLVAGLGSGGAFPVGITTVTYEAADAQGNIGTASFTVTVSDAEIPVVSVPMNIVTTTDAGQPTAAVTYAVTATDNVGVTSGPTLVAGVASGGAFPIGTTTVTYNASDAAGNTGTASFTVTVTDGENPVVSVPANIAVGTDAGQTTAVVTYAAPTASDNVGVTSGPTLVAGPASGATFPIGTTTVTYEAADAQGNTGSASFTVTVNDNESPVVSVPANISVAADAGQATAVVSYAAPTATDNVGVTSGPTRVAGLASGAAFPVGITTVTYEASDGDGNTGSGSFTVTVTDGQSPVVTVPGNITVPTDGGLATAAVTYAAPTATDNVGVTSGPTLVAGLASGAAFPLGTTIVTYEASDGDGNTGSASFTVTVVDQQEPVVIVSTNYTAEAGPSGTASVAFSALATDNADPSPVLTYTLNSVTISSPYDFPVGPNVVQVTAEDNAGNVSGVANLLVTVTAADAPPVPVISGTINVNRSMTISGTAEVDSTVRVTFPDTSFQVVTATGGTFSVTSTADMLGGTVSVTAADALGNTSPAATVDLFPDYEGPTVTISGAPSRLVDLTPFTVTITFSENVTGFVQGDVNLAGGTITAFAGSGAVYTAEITPNLAEDVVISIGAAVAEDDFANPNEASGTVNISNATMTETEEMVTQAAQQRILSLFGTQPRLNRFLVGGQLGSFNANVTQGVGNFDFTTSSDRPVWVAGQGQWSTQGDMETSYANVAVGAHFEPTANVLLGVMAQFDNAVSDEGVARLESTGWMVGPYAVARMANQPLVFSGSYLMGQSDNTLSPLGTYKDDFASDRVLATLGVAGEVELTRLTLIPLLDLAYASDENEAYVDGDSNPVRSMKVTSTQATLGLDFVMPIMIENGSFDLIGGIGASLTSNDNGLETTDVTRGQTELGFRYGMENGGRLTARATYDGLGADDYEAFGAEVIFEISF